MESNQYAGSWDRIISILQELRLRCPWDKKQTIESLRSLTIEEVYELADAITEKDWSGIQEELGDVLLHLLFYCRIAEEQNHFNIHDVIAQLCEKLVMRHPHIYAETIAPDEDAVKRNWEKIKMQNKSVSLLNGVPKTLPAMVKAFRLQEKTKQVGFEWEYTHQVKAKLFEELQELDEAVDSGNHIHMEEELGDVLFSLINYARFLNIDPELALERTNKKFISRFQQMEERAETKKKSLAEMSLQEMDALWNSIKKKGKR